jgi:hypothetical protein
MMLAEIAAKLTSQKLVWQFRLSKARRVLTRVQNFKRERHVYRSANKAAPQKNASRDRGPGEATPQVRGERR